MMQGQIPAGLQSLIARGMSQPTRPSPIPQGMQVLMNAKRQLEQVANPMTPAGTPTVAGQMEQAIAQRVQSPMPQGMPQDVPQGMPGMLPNDPFREQMMKTLQMQAQQQMQPPGGGQPQEQPPQQPPQPMAAGGIAALPADNMARIERYAHGGVIGFDGVTRSDVPDPLISQTSDTALQKIEAEKAKNARDLADKYKQSLNVMSAVANSGDQQAIQKYAASTQENLDALRNYVNTSYGNRADQVLNTVLSATKPVEEKPKYTYEEPVKSGISTGTQQRQTAITPDKRVAKPSIAQSGAPVTAAAPSGLQMSPELAEDRRRVQEMLNAAPPGNAPTLQSVMSTREQARQAQGLKGLIGSAIEESIAKQAERDAALQAQYQKGTEGRGLENLIAGLSAGARGRVGSLGETYVKTAQEQRAADINFQQLMNASAAKRDEMNATVQGMREAAASNDTNTLYKLQEHHDKLKAEDMNIKRQLASALVQSSTQLTEGGLDRTSKEKIARMQLQASMMQPSEQKRIDDLTRVYILKLTGGKPPTPDQYLEAMKNAMEDVRGASQAGSRDIKAQTEANKQLDAFKTSMEYVTAKTPAEQQALLRNKQAELERQYPGAVFGAGTPTMPKPGEVRSGFKFKGGDPGDKNNWEKV